MKRTIPLLGALILAGVAFVAPVQAAQNQAASATPTVTMTITAVGKKDKTPPALKKDDVQLYKNKERLQTADLRHAEDLLLAVVIDDSLDSTIANQWGDLKAFFEAQPPTTAIGVFYSSNGTVRVAQEFTTDHALASKALRLPIGNLGAFSSPYLAVQDMMKRWPSAKTRRSIIMLSSGIDYFRRGFGPKSPDLDPTIERAQKENINIWTVYAPDAGHFGRGFFRQFNAQSNLSELSEETGGETYFLGTQAPVTLKPYFDEIAEHLKNQYLVTFAATGGGKKGKFERIRVGTELNNLEFLMPTNTFIPPAQ